MSIELSTLKAVETVLKFLHEHTSLYKTLTLTDLLALKKLELTSRNLVTIPSEIGALTNLEELHLSKNCLTALPSSIRQLKHLRSLSVDNNKLTILPAELSQLTMLEQFSAVSNHLTSIDNVDWSALSKLHTLSVYKNKLTSVPEVLCQLPELKCLDLAKNDLDVLPPAFGQWIKSSPVVIIALEGNNKTRDDLLYPKPVASPPVAASSSVHEASPSAAAVPEADKQDDTVKLEAFIKMVDALDVDQAQENFSALLTHATNFLTTVNESSLNAESKSYTAIGVTVTILGTMMALMTALAVKKFNAKKTQTPQAATTTVASSTATVSATVEKVEPLVAKPILVEPLCQETKAFNGQRPRWYWRIHKGWLHWQNNDARIESIRLSQITAVNIQDKMCFPGFNIGGVCLNVSPAVGGGERIFFYEEKDAYICRALHKALLSADDKTTLCESDVI